MEREFFEIPRLDEYQKYEYKNPNWIMLHTCLLDDYRFHLMSDSSRLLCILLWIQASRTGNCMPKDDNWVHAKTGVKHIDWEELIRNEQISILPKRRKSLINKGRTLPREKRRVEKSKEFDTFWALYPKKKSKGQALKTWEKLQVDTPLYEQILEGLQRAKVAWKARGEPEYIPYPSTWLNAMGWLDEEVVSSESAADVEIYI